MVAIILAFIAGIVWAVRLEGRVNAQDRELSTQDRQVSTLESRQQQSLQQFREDLAYIRSRIDQALDKGSR